MEKRRDKPRFKPKKSKDKNMIEQRRIDDPNLLDKNLPDNLKVDIASFIIEFSQLEMSATHFVWDILKLTPDSGKLVMSGLDTLDRFELGKKLSERFNIPIHEDSGKVQQVWTDIRQTTQARNKVAHGVWYLIDGVPAAFSYRIPVEPGLINSEIFTSERLQLLAKVCRAATLLFEAMCLKAQLLNEERDKPAT